MAARNYSNIAVETTLATGITSGEGSLTVVDASGWPSAPFILVIEPDTVNEELILVGGKTGAVFSSLTRGFGGTSQLAHNAGVTIKHVVTAEDHTLVWTHVHSGAGGDDTSQVPHANLSGIGSDDHHAQIHTLSGADHTGNIDDGQVPASAVTQHQAALVITESQISDLDHNDPEAIHDNVASEINAVTLKGSPHVDDMVLIEDSEAAFVKKRASVGSISSAASTTDHGTLNGLGDDDHSIYHTDARALTWHSGLSGAHVTNGDSHDHVGGDGAQIDHGGLAGLGDDDHTQYLRADGTRQVSGHLDPNIDNARDLGDSVLSWRAVYAHEIRDENGTLILNTSARILDGGPWEVDGNLLPITEAANYDLGSDTQAWDRVYAHAIYDENGSAVIDLSARAWFGGFNPDVDVTRDIGTATLTWRRLYVEALYNESGTAVMDTTSGAPIPANLWAHNNVNGSIRWLGTGTALAQAHTTSSAKYKREVEAEILESPFMRLRPKKFRYIDNHPYADRFGDTWQEFENPNEGRWGFMYEDVLEDAPRYAYVVDDMEAVSYEGMLPDFIAWATASLQHLLRAA